MRKSETPLRSKIRSRLSEADAMHVVLLLSSMGIEPDVESNADGRLDVFVSDADLAEAERLLAEDARTASDEVRRSADAALQERRAQITLPGREEALAAPPAWFGRGSWAVFALAGVCVAQFVAANTGEAAGSRSRLLDLGAISYSQIHAGEYWRFLTAIFLHFDVAHLLANLSVMLIVAPPLAHQLGALRFLVVFLVTGVGANVASHVLAPGVGLKAGASGAIAGVLGALGGQALRPEHETRYKSWQRLGALAAIYGLMIGFGPGRDNVAHLSGLVIGIALGRWMAPSPVAQ